MNAGRIAAAAGAMVIAVSAGAAGAARASSPTPPASRGRAPAPGLPGARTGSCQRMMREYPAMARMHEQMMHGTRGMGQMNQQMAGTAPAGMTGGNSAAMAGPADR